MKKVKEPQLASVSLEDTDIAAIADFGTIEGKLNPRQHGSNTSQPLASQGLQNIREEIKAMHFYATRTHDWALWNQGQRMIDTHFIFPLMKLDPKDPSNYYFKPTDDMIAIARECGMRIFYRMGTSIEHTSGIYPGNHYNTIIPDDFKKYAEVLAGIIRHYREGWADGFHFKDMEYWEIWNEPDLGDRMWSGTKEQFIEFFVTVLKHLKKEFPDIKVGGPAMCWLHKEYFAEILAACKKAKVAPDFISWHCYTENANGLIQQPVDARAMLDEAGFKKTEICINEWHYLITWSGVQSSASSDMRKMVIDGKTGLNNIDGAAFNLAVLAGWQKGPLDTGFYYGANIDGNWGIRNTDRKFNKSFYSMKMFGKIMAGYASRVKSENRFATIHTLGALSADGKKGCLLVDDYRGERTVLEIKVKGLAKARNFQAVILDNEHDLTPVPATYCDGKLTLVKHEYGSAAFLVTFDL